MTKADLIVVAEDAIYAMDPGRLRSVLVAGLDSSSLLEPDGMPLIHAAIDAAVDAGAGGGIPTIDCVRVLLEFGAKLDEEYLGRTAAESIRESPALAALLGDETPESS